MEYTERFNKIESANGRCSDANIECDEECPLWSHCNSVFYHSPVEILEHIREYNKKRLVQTPQTK